MALWSNGCEDSGDLGRTWSLDSVVVKADSGARGMMKANEQEREGHGTAL
jgi:hypothetical protein